MPGPLERARGAGGGPEQVTQWRVQRYCWDELPHTSLPGSTFPDATQGEGHRRRAVALAALLDELGLPRYAAIARSEVTGEVLALAQVAPERARALARRAAQRSGIEPPNTELITWGASLGPAEASALETVADTLELAVAAGELVPGGRGWRERQGELAAAVLMRARDDLAGRAPYQQLLCERMACWARGSGSTTRSSLLVAAGHPAARSRPAGPRCGGPRRPASS